MNVVVLMVMAGLAGGVVLVAVAGARRTASSLARSDRDARADDVLVNPNNTPTNAQHWASVATLPQVATVASTEGLAVFPLDSHGLLDESYQNASTIGSPDASFLHTIDRPRVLSGRLADENALNEVIVNEVAAREHHLHAGDVVHLGIFSMATGPATQNAAPRLVRTVEGRVVGVVLPVGDAARAPDDPNLSSALLYTTAMFRAVPEGGRLYTGKAVRLRGGASAVPAFESGVRDLIGRDIPDGAGINFQERALSDARTYRAIRPYVFALVAFAALSALTALAVVGQVLVRSQRHLREERDQLRALGFTRGTLLSVAAARGLVIGIGAAVVAVLVAFLASPLMPLGPMRAVDSARGFSADWSVFSVGALIVITGIVVCCAASLAWSGRASTSQATTGMADTIARAGAPVPITSGVRFAFDRGSSAPVPLRTTLLGIAVALTAIFSTLVFASGLERFTSTPARYGFPWNYVVLESANSVADALPGEAKVAAALAHAPAVQSFGFGRFSQFDIKGRSVAAVGLSSDSFVPVLRGRAPARSNELVLGETTMRTTGTHLGDRITVSLQGVTRSMLVVGTAVFPRLAPYPASEPTGLGIGAATTADAIPATSALGSPFFVVRFKPGAPATVAALKKLVPDPTLVYQVLAAQRPNDVLSYNRLTRTPLVLAAVLVLLAMASVIHLLVTGVRAHRRDIALLKTIGMTRREATVSVLTEATVWVGLALAVAIPLGLVAGRWLWIETARWLGIADDASLPLVLIFAVAAAAIVVVNLVAWGPGRIAARLRPANVLRSE